VWLVPVVFHQRNDRTDPPVPRENVYGHLQRLLWIRDRLGPADRAIELGCGTGVMVTLPLRAWGYNVTGVDLDEASIDCGRAVFDGVGVDPRVISTSDLRDLEGDMDAVIATEVLEHLEDDELCSTLSLIHRKLRPGGRLLVTVPNGYGLFELESFLWFRCGLDRVYRRRRANMLIWAFRKRMFGDYVDSPYPSTMAHSPHKQRFTLSGIRRLLERNGFLVTEARGSVLIAGPLTNLLLTGWDGAMALNARLGERVSPVAAGFYLLAETPA
jgi:SAM-dependent methyltransferase